MEGNVPNVRKKIFLGGESSQTGFNRSNRCAKIQTKRFPIQKINLLNIPSA
jgi:hypothetical protein